MVVFSVRAGYGETPVGCATGLELYQLCGEYTGPGGIAPAVGKTRREVPVPEGLPRREPECAGSSTG